MTNQDDVRRWSVTGQANEIRRPFPPKSNLYFPPKSNLYFPPKLILYFSPKLNLYFPQKFLTLSQAALTFQLPCNKYIH